MLGVGSELRGDDAAGILVAQSLEKKFLKLKSPGKNPQDRFRVFIGGTVPENLTGEIKRFKPTHLLIVDAADVGLKKGGVKFVDPQDVTGLSSSTHQFPMKIFADYISRSVGCRIGIIGIQPAQMKFDAPPSKEIKKSVKLVADVIAEVVFSE